MLDQHSRIAYNRFGLGAKPDDAKLADPRGWLKAQVSGAPAALPASLAALPTTPDALRQARDIILARRDARKTEATDKKPDDKKPGEAGPVAAPAQTTMAETKPLADAKPKPNDQAALRDLYVDQVAARIDAALTTSTPFHERLVHFWTNHFAVSADKQKVRALVGPYEIEAIRANMGGSFTRMLMAVAHHPAMILYLDNERSFGPDSPFIAQRRGRGDRDVGLNENLGRELLELYTLGVRTGYTQTDVTELARAITGWSVESDRPAFERFMQKGEHGFAYYDPVHEPGTRTVLGKRYGQQGHDQGVAILADLAAHPATARHIATKLARHFIADDPPPSAVARLEQVFLATNGDLSSLHRALVDLPEAWAEKPGAKFKTPWDYVISVGRLTGLPDLKPRPLVGLFQQMGQAVYVPGAPAGWPDDSAHWLSTDGLSKRIDFASLVGRMKGVAYDGRTLATQLYGPALSVATRSALTNAASGAQALTLLLVSPEFMRRV